MISLFFYPVHTNYISNYISINKQANNSEVTYFNLLKHSQRRMSWLAAISNEKGNLPSNVFVCSGHFKDKYFVKSTDFFTQRDQ